MNTRTCGRCGLRYSVGEHHVCDLNAPEGFDGVSLRGVDNNTLHYRVGPAIESGAVPANTRTTQDIDVEPDTLSYNVGNSDYAKHAIQPWHIWLEYKLNGWDCDVVKRILRTKAEPGVTPVEARIMDYEKIIHDCRERIRQLQELGEEALF